MYQREISMTTWMTKIDPIVCLFDNWPAIYLSIFLFIKIYTCATRLT
jgi:hypothetical protein